MFVGHYSVSLVAKAYAKDAPLGLLFLAVQLLDILFFPFAIVGIEQLKIVPHFTQSTHFELPFMPYTHSLVAALSWAAVSYVAAALWFKRRVTKPHWVATAVAIAVFSHWALDLIVHTPDLPILGDSSTKLGLGLWRSAIATAALELFLTLVGLFLYLRSTRANSPMGKWAMPCFVGLLLIIGVVNIFGPPLGNSVTSLAAVALGSYFGFAAVAVWLERYRIPTRSHGVHAGKGA